MVFGECIFIALNILASIRVYIGMLGAQFVKVIGHIFKFLDM